MSLFPVLHKIISFLLLTVLPFFLFSAEKGGDEQTPFASAMTELNPAVQQHLKGALREIGKTDTGKFLFEHVSPNLKFSSKPMVQLGVADTQNVITLENLRLEHTLFAGDPQSALDKTKICFTTEILSHELLHNAQMHAGLFQYPQGCSGYEAVLCEKLLELQSKYTGEAMFDTIRRQEDYMPFVPEKPRLLLFLRGKSDTYVQEYLETLWQNKRTTSAGRRLYREQVIEVVQWNAAYAEQAFRNNYGRFLAGGKGVGADAITVHLNKIISFTKMPITADFLLKNACVQPIPHGIACYENGVKVMEYVAVQGGYVKRKISGQLVQETMVRAR